MILLTPIQNYNLIDVFLFFSVSKIPAIIEHNLIILLKMPTPPFFCKQTPNLTQQNCQGFKLVILTYDEGDCVRAVQAVLWYSLALCVKRVDGLKITK